MCQLIITMLRAATAASPEFFWIQSAEPGRAYRAGHGSLR